VALHHIQHWADGGDTSLENLTLLCRYHHHLIHHDHWTIHMIDGRPWYYPPTWIDPHQQPRPGGRVPLHDAG
jgi:HNH endonuclease